MLSPALNYILLKFGMNLSIDFKVFEQNVILGDSLFDHDQELHHAD